MLLHQPSLKHEAIPKLRDKTCYHIALVKLVSYYPRASKPIIEDNSRKRLHVHTS